MSKPARLNGLVRISGEQYRVIGAPRQFDGSYRIIVQSIKTALIREAFSELWRAKCGPWKFSPAIKNTALMTTQITAGEEGE